MPVPEGLSWIEAGGVPEVFTTAHDALFTQARPARRRAPARARRRRRRRHRRRAARRGGGRPRHRDGAQREPARRRRRARRPRRSSIPRASPSTARSTSSWSSSARPTSRGDLQALATSGRIVVIGIGGGAKAELNLGALMGKRATVRASTLRPRPLEEKALTARAMERHVLPLFERGALRVPVAADLSAGRGRARPTSASPPAASWARSCWSCA